MRTALDVALTKPQLASQPQVQALDVSLREDLDEADRLLESFLVLARAQRGALGAETLVSLARVVGDALARRGGAIAAKQLELHRALAPASVAGSQTLLARMVDNLIDNSVRHNLHGGLINVTCETDQTKARLIVESAGSVLNPAAVAQLTEPFRRLGPERASSQNGHGLGLSIVAAIATAHGGTLTPRSRARRPGSRRHPAGRPGPATREPTGMRVLVVEDAARLANWIAEGLRDQGIAVDIAYDGTEAASRLHVNPYDVVVLDRDLPGIHGDTLCRMITESDEPAMVLMLTAAGTADDRVTGLTLGADDYLPKPFHFPELVLRVRALGRRKPTAQPRTVRASGIELNPLTGIVSRDGRSIDLTPKERAVLEALLKASPGGLTAEKLLEQAWDENADPFTTTVKVTIGRLRRKLGEPGVIKTTPGVGYRITNTNSE